MLESDVLESYKTWFERLSFDDKYELYYDYRDRNQYDYDFLKFLNPKFEDYVKLTADTSDSIRYDSLLKMIKDYVLYILNDPPERILKKNKRKSRVDRTKAKKVLSPQREMTITFED